MISNYGELRAAVATRSHRTDLTSLIPDFIRRAHDIIVSEVALAADLTISTQSTTLPTGFREALSLFLINRPMVQLTEASAEETQYISGTGVPVRYRIDTTLKVYPTPRSSYLSKLLYRIARTFFSADADTNAILTKYPFVYLYGSLAELFRHTMDDERADRLEIMFRAEIDRINQTEVGDATRGMLQTTSVAP